MANVLTAKDLLDLWERGLTSLPLKRTLELLAIAYPEMSPGQIREMPIGRRDARLLAIREALFGPRLPCLTGCPKCSEHLEIVFDTTQLRAESKNTSLLANDSVTVGDYEVYFRLPSSEDMFHIAGLPDPTQGRRVLFERCVEHATHDGSPVSAADIPEEVIQAV